MTTTTTAAATTTIPATTDSTAIITVAKIVLQKGMAVKADLCGRNQVGTYAGDFQALKGSSSILRFLKASPGQKASLRSLGILWVS